MRRRLSTPQTLEALQKIDGRTPYYKRLMDVVGSAIIMMLLAHIVVVGSVGDAEPRMQMGRIAKLAYDLDGNAGVG
jgi:uncharacterized membrane protein YjjP (DUF1212 family)